MVSMFNLAAAGSSQMLLFSGDSGVGKSALLGEASRYAAGKNCHLLSVKFDQLKNVAPYAALKTGLKKFIDHILTSTPENLDQLRKRLKEALGCNDAIITALIPNLELLIPDSGAETVSEESLPKEIENRFNVAFENFAQAFAEKKSPFFIIFDDLQWVDDATGRLLTHLMLSAGENTVIIGAYRRNEPQQIMPIIDNLRSKGVRINIMSVESLCVEDIGCILADTFGRADITELSKICHKKTNGNPLFLSQIILSICDRGYIHYDAKKGGWAWDIDAIEHYDVSDNIAEIVKQRLHEADPHSLDLLCIGAFLGENFDSESLSLISGETPGEVMNQLDSFVHRGYLILSKEYRQVTDDRSLIRFFYRFSHDKIQQAAYSLLSPGTKERLHLDIGEKLLSTIPNIKDSGELFRTVSHLNRGVRLTHDPKLIELLIELNETAGKRARVAASWQSAYEYYTFGIFLLPENAWEANYKLTFGLYLGAAEAAYLTDKFEKALSYTTIIREKAQGLLDASKAYMVDINSHIAQGKPTEAIKIGLEILNRLGVRLPESISAIGKAKLLLAIISMRSRLKRQGFDRLRKLGPMTNERNIAALKIMGALGTSAYLASSVHFVLFALKSIEFFVNDGYHAEAAYSCVRFGAVLCNALKDFDFGYKLGELGLSLADRTKSVSIKTRVVYSTAAGIFYYNRHYKDLIAPLKEYHRIGREAGELEFSAYNAYAYCYMRLLMGESLSLIDRLMTEYSQQVYAQDTVVNLFRIYNQTVQNFMGLSRDPCVLTGNIMDEALLNHYFKEKSNTVGLFEIMVNKMWLCIIYGEYGKAFDLVEPIESILPQVISKHNVPLAHFYQVLAICAVFHKLSRAEQKRWLKKCRNKIKLYSKWAFSGPTVFRHKQLLMIAELARVQSKHGEASDSYLHAIDHAKANGFIQEEALCCELSAIYYRKIDNVEYQKLIRRAYDLYGLWGATKKCERLEFQHKNVLSNGSRSTAVLNSKGKVLSEIELSSVLKASQAISREISYSKLTETLMSVTAKNAGAQKGILLERSQNGYIILGHYNTSQTPEYPESIVNVVANTGEVLVITDACKSDYFMVDPYIQRFGVKSILCVPLRLMNSVFGILYLENNLMPNAFPRDRVEVLEILASQAAISLQNAKMYEKAETALRVSENTLHELTEGATDGIIQIDEEARLLLWNAAAEKIFGYPKEQVLGKDIFSIVVAEDRREFNRQKFAKFLGHQDKENKGWTFVDKGVRANGEIFPLEVSASKVNINNKWFTLGIVRDISDKIRQEQQLRSSEKMRAIGQLAGGVAHDFNNLLHAIQTYATLAAGKANPRSATYKYMKTIEEIVTDGAKLTEQILGFARGGKIRVEPICANDLIIESSDMFKRTKKELSVYVSLSQERWLINVDSGQIKQVLLNLYLNAWQAMPNGGDIFIKTENVTLSSNTGFPFPVSPGKYILISIKDTGEGMTTETMEKMYEPFFTTRPVGQGNGLGLSSSYGIIKNHEGYIHALSALGEGTTFNLYLPKSVDKEMKKIEKDSQYLLEGKGTALIVDDEKRIIESSSLMLQSLGYDVLKAYGGIQAIELLQKHTDSICLVILDYYMPGMLGTHVHQKLKSIKPDIDVLMVSGYKQDGFTQEQMSGIAFLHKPYTVYELSEAIKNLHT